MRSGTSSAVKRAALIGALLVITLFGPVVGTARAEIIVGNAAVFEETLGIWRWEYFMEVGPTQEIRTGTVFTIYDFDGYVAGSEMYTDTETGGTWAFTASLTGITPTGLASGPDPVPADNPLITNLSWTYAGPTFPSGTAQTEVGIFSAQSIYEPTAEYFLFNDWFAGEAYLKGSVATRIFNSEDNISVPLDPVPEPGSMLLLSTGLFGAASMIRRRRKAQADARQVS